MGGFVEKWAEGEACEGWGKVIYWVIETVPQGKNV